MRLNLFYLLFFIASAAFAQRIANFNLYPLNSNVVVKFSIGPGASCTGYSIYHSTDSLNYITISDYSGICGGSGSTEDYSFTHTSPALNQTNFYKVQIYPFETSPVRRIFVGETSQLRMYTYPNPVNNFNDVFYLKFINTNNIRVVGFLYNQFGNPVRELDISTKVDLATLDVNALGNGMYVLWLTDGINAYTAKFIINRQ